MRYIRRVGILGLLFVYTTLYAQRYEIRTAKQLLSSATDSIRYVDALNKVSALYLNCQLDSGGIYAHNAYNIAARNKYLKGIADANRNLGRYYLLRPQVYLATRCFDHALIHYRQAGDSVGVALTLAQLAVCYHFQRNQVGANLSITASFKSVIKPSDSIKSFLLVTYYAVFINDSTTRRAAKSALNELNSLNSQSVPLNVKLLAQLYVAKELIEAGKMDTAIGLLKNNLQQSDTSGLTYMSLYTCNFLGTQLAVNRNKDSIFYQQKMIEYGVEGGYTGLILGTVNKLASYYLKKNDQTRAAEYSRIALQIMQQQQEGIKQGEADYLSYFFGDEKLRTLKRQHESQSALLASTSTNSRFAYYQMILIIIAVLILGIFLSVIYRLYKLSYSSTVSLKEWQHELVIGNRALQQNDDFKNKLISMIAHDFRTPLHNIVSITGFVNEEVLTVTEAAAMIKQVDKTAEYTLQLFEEISRWIRTQISGFKYQPISLSVNELISKTQQSLGQTLHEKNIRLVVDIPPSTYVLGDFEMIQFIHRNFLHNAIKFSSDNGIIRIVSEKENGVVKILFVDEGAGIDKDILPQLFIWNNTTKDKDRMNKGAGLALIICKDFIEKMNGTIGAFNNEDEGSTFYYQLPCIEI
ncbi:sensor histidine kinase [Chitinophaga silvatica]|uniref:histidine kinase n=1 Tax=Chitinophaga silvatica TaxID=2282649 RepID=A0A3E1YDI1_9BACT|nr:HAMP domain-containing sensor histidine kinase [Chitinophaga silvatica]RFS24568.1 sensor histidine kinase [Chitinophaga silvatica]